jgi:PAS domain S-box-containing protein
VLTAARSALGVTVTPDHMLALEDLPSDYSQLMIDSITEGMLVRLDASGAIASWHAGAERLTQYSAEESIGRDVSILYPPDEVAGGVPARDLAAAADGPPHVTEGWWVRKDGSQVWCSRTFTVMRGRSGAVHGYVLTARDMTERREEELALRRIEQMVDGVADYEIIRLDSQGVIRSWNTGARRLTGYEAAEVIGRHVSMFFTEEDTRAGLVESELSAAVREGRLETEGWRLRRDGSRFWASISIAPIRDEGGELTGFVKVARDLTERRQQEELVQRQRDEILELSTPVIQVWERVIVLPLIGTLDSVRAARLTEGLLERISAELAEVVILDVSGVPAIDSGVARHLLKTVEAARLMGTASILSGVRPEIAQSIVHLGIDLDGLRSRASLKDALQLALRMIGVGGNDSGREPDA